VTNNRGSHQAPPLTHSKQPRRGGGTSPYADPAQFRQHVAIPQSLRIQPHIPRPSRTSGSPDVEPNFVLYRITDPPGIVNGVEDVEHYAAPIGTWPVRRLWSITLRDEFCTRFRLSHVRAHGYFNDVAPSRRLVVEYLNSTDSGVFGDAGSALISM
jgi:hypothetical protein